MDVLNESSELEVAGEVWAETELVFLEEVVGQKEVDESSSEDSLKEFTTVAKRETGRKSAGEV